MMKLTKLSVTIDREIFQDKTASLGDLWDHLVEIEAISAAVAKAKKKDMKIHILLDEPSKVGTYMVSQLSEHMSDCYGRSLTLKTQLLKFRT